MITDEMVEKAWEAFEVLPMDAHYSQAMRAALNAVSPALIAQGMIDAAFMAYCDGHIPTGDRIIAHAQELDPQ